MIVIVITISGVLISYKISKSINNVVDKRLLERYKTITEEKNGNWVAISNLIDDYPKLFKMAPNIIQKFIPIYNILYSLYRSFSADYYSVLLENYIDWYDARVMPQDGTIDPVTFQPKKEKEIKEYFVGYNNELGRRVNIFFEYDGETSNFTDDTSEEFSNLPPEQQVEIFVKILYKIFIGDAKEYAYSHNIREIFNAQLVTLLISVNEDDYELYIDDEPLVEEEDKPMVRKRTE